MKYILQFSNANGGGEYLVIIDKKPSAQRAMKEWGGPDVQLDGIYAADLEPLTKGRSENALPTDAVLQVRF